MTIFWTMKMDISNLAKNTSSSWFRPTHFRNTDQFKSPIRSNEVGPNGSWTNGKNELGLGYIYRAMCSKWCKAVAFMRWPDHVAQHIRGCVCECWQALRCVRPTYVLQTHHAQWHFSSPARYCNNRYNFFTIYHFYLFIKFMCCIDEERYFAQIH